MAVNIPGLPKVPERPQFAADHDALWFILTNPCGTPPTVLIQTALNPALNAAIELIWLDTEDLLTNLTSPENPKGGRLGAKKGTRGKKRHKPTLNQTIGSALDDLFGHPLDIGDNKKWTAGQLTLWGLYELVDRFLFAWLVIGVTEDFLINWASLIYLETKDPLKCPDGLKAKGNGGGAIGLPGWLPLVCPEITYQRGNVSWQVIFGTVPSGNWSITAAFTGDVGPGGDGYIEAQIGIFKDPLYIEPFIVSEEARLPTGSSRSLAVSTVVKGPEIFFPAIRSNLGNWIPIDDGALVNVQELAFHVD